MADVADRADAAPTTPRKSVGHTRGQAWLLDVDNPAKWIAACPKEKLPQVWVQLRHACGQLFAAGTGLASSLVEDSAVTVCRLVAQYATTGDRMDENITECANTLNLHILDLYDYPRVQYEAACTLTTLLVKESLPPNTTFTNLLLWAVYDASQLDAPAEAVSRLNKIKDGLNNIAWDDDRARDFVNHVLDLVNPNFMRHPHAADVLAQVCSQKTGSLTRSIHKRWLPQLIDSARRLRRPETKTLSTAFIKTWDKLTGLHLAVFEEEAVKPYINCAIRAQPSHYFAFKEVLVSFKQSAVGASVKAREGLQRLLAGSDVISMIDAPNALIRRNVIGILGDHFPVCQVGLNKASLEGVLTEQLGHLVRAMNDPCPIVRHAAVTGFGRVVTEHWESLPKSVVLPAIDTMCKNMAYDRTDGSIRVAVLKVLKGDFLPNDLIRPVVATLLPGLKHIDDAQTKARQLYAAMLVDLMAYPDVARDDLVDAETLIRRLGCEKNKQVQDSLVKYLMNSAEYLWFGGGGGAAGDAEKKEADDAGDAEPPEPKKTKKALQQEKAEEEEAATKRVVRAMLTIVTKWPSAALPLYRGMVRQSAVAAKALVGVVQKLMQWCIGCRLAQGSQVEDVLALCVGFTQEIWATKLAKKTKGRAELAKVLQEGTLEALEATCGSYACKQMTNILRSVAAKCSDAAPDVTQHLDAFRNYTSAGNSATAGAAAAPAGDAAKATGKKKATIDAPAATAAPAPAADADLKLLLHRLVAEGGVGDVLAVILDWLADEKMRKRGLECVVEVLLTQAGRDTLVTDARWGAVVELLMGFMEGTTKLLRSPMAKETPEPDVRLRALEQEVLCRVATCRAAARLAVSQKEEAAQKAKQQQQDKDKDKGKGKGKGKGKDGEESADDKAPAAKRNIDATPEMEDLLKVANVMVNSMLPAAKRARRQGAQLLAVLVAEQVILFLTKAVECFLLITRKGFAPGFKQVFDGEQTLDTVVAACPHLLPRVLQFITAALRMQCAHLVLTSWSEYVMKLLTHAVLQCDALQPISADPADIPENVEHREKAWAYLADHGIYRYAVEEFTAGVYKATKVPEEFVTALWTFVTQEVGGYSVAPFLFAEALGRFSKPVALFLESVVDLFKRAHTGGRDLTPSEASGIAMTFAALLAAGNRALTARLVQFKTEVLDPFFTSYTLFAGGNGAGAAGAAAPAVNDDPHNAGGLFGSQDSTGGANAASQFAELQKMLESLDWTVPAPRVTGVNASATASQAASVRGRSVATTHHDDMVSVFDDGASVYPATLASQAGDAGRRADAGGVDMNDLLDDLDVEADEAGAPQRPADADPDACLDSDSEDDAAARPVRKRLSVPPRTSVDATGRIPGAGKGKVAKQAQGGRKRKADDTAGAARKRVKKAVAAALAMP